MANYRSGPIVGSLVVAALLATYAGGYFGLGHADRDGNGDRVRAFDHRWLAIAFYPAARVEGMWLGEPVRAVFGIDGCWNGVWD